MYIQHNVSPGMTEPVSFATDYQYIDYFEHPTHIRGGVEGGGDFGNSENFEALTK